MKKLLLLLLIFTAAKISFSQISFEQRIEFDLKEDDFKGHSLYSFGEAGFVIESNTPTKKGYKQFKYELFSSSLSPIKSHVEKVKMSKTAKYGTYNSKTHFATLVYDITGEAKVISVKGESLEAKTNSFTIPRSFNYHTAELVGEKLYLYGRVKKNPVIIFIDCETGKNTIVPIKIDGFKSTKIFFKNLSIIEKSGEAFCTFSAVKGSKISLFIIKFDSNNKKQELVDMTSSFDKYLKELSVKNIGTNKYILTGTYSSKLSNTSEGIFFAQLDGNKIKDVRYTNFLDLSNFLNYLPEKKQAKIENKKSKKEAAGKELTMNYDILNHELLVGKDCYYYIGEAYYPTYRTETYPTFVNGRPVVQVRKVFDGYQYTHAIIVKYSLDGKILWDQTFEMWSSTKPLYIKKFIIVGDNFEKSLDLVFASKNRIVSKSFDNNGKILYDRKSDEIPTETKGDVTKDGFSDIEYWFDNYFLAFGIQVIKNKENEDVNKKREVFFINKFKWTSIN